MTTKQNITKNFWKPCDKVLEPETEMVKPNFSEINCVHYFRNTLKCFTRPSWMKEFENPTTDFNMQPPTYVEVTKFIMKMKPSTSPCPLDQISVIAFKKFLVLSSCLTNICQIAWTAKTLHYVWKSEVTVLAYKKGDAQIQRTFVQSPCNLYYRKYLLPSFEIDFSTSLRKKNTLKRIFKKVFGRLFSNS